MCAWIKAGIARNRSAVKERCAPADIRCGEEQGGGLAGVAFARVACGTHGCEGNACLPGAAGEICVARLLVVVVELEHDGDDAGGFAAVVVGADERFQAGPELLERRGGGGVEVAAVDDV